MTSLIRQMAYMGFKEDFDVPKQAMNIPRYSMMVCGMFCSIAVSAVYAFGLLTDKLRTDYHFTQNDITTVSTVGMVIGYLTFPFGLIYDYMGPKPIFTIGIVLNVVGTLMFALVFNGTVPANVVGVSLINSLLNLGCAMFDMGSVLTVLSWFPLDRGLVIACMKTSTGLGSSIVSTIYNTYFSGDHTTYMYFLLSYSAVIGTIAIALIYLPPFHMTGSRLKNYSEETHRKSAAYESVYMQKKAPVKRFALALCLVLTTLVVLTTRSVVLVFVKDLSPAQKHASTAIVIILYTLLLTVVLPLKWFDKQPSFYDRENIELANANKSSADDSEENNSDPYKSVADAEVEEIDLSMYDPTKEPATAKEARVALRLVTESEKIAPQFPTGFFYNIRRPTLLCMWVAGFCTAGVVLVVTMNVTEIFIAVSKDPEDKQSPALYVALVGIGSALGRLTMAFCEVGTVSKPADKRIPITIFYIVPPAVCLLACVFFLIIPAKGLLLPMILSGFGNGFYAACEVITARTIFSLDISKHYNSLFFFEVVSLIFMNRLLFGELMTRNSTVLPDGSPVCLGRKECIQTTFIVLTCLSAVGLVASIGTHLTYRAYARGEHTKRAEHRAHLEGLLVSFEEAESRQKLTHQSWEKEDK